MVSPRPLFQLETRGLGSDSSFRKHVHRRGEVARCGTEKPQAVHPELCGRGEASIFLHYAVRTLFGLLPPTTIAPPARVGRPGRVGCKERIQWSEIHFRAVDWSERRSPAGNPKPALNSSGPVG